MKISTFPREPPYLRGRPCTPQWRKRTGVCNLSGYLWNAGGTCTIYSSYIVTYTTLLRDVFPHFFFSPPIVGQMIQVDYVAHILPGSNHGRRHHHHHQWALSWTDQFESPKLSHHSILEESCVRIDVVSRVVRHDPYHSFSRMGSHCTVDKNSI